MVGSTPVLFFQTRGTLQSEPRLRRERRCEHPHTDQRSFGMVKHIEVILEKLDRLKTYKLLIKRPSLHELYMNAANRILETAKDGKCGDVERFNVQ